jgi:hypothetical protein
MLLGRLGRDPTCSTACHMGESGDAWLEKGGSFVLSMQCTGSGVGDSLHNLKTAHVCWHTRPVDDVKFMHACTCV